MTGSPPASAYSNLLSLEGKSMPLIVAHTERLRGGKVALMDRLAEIEPRFPHNFHKGKTRNSKKKLAPLNSWKKICRSPGRREREESQEGNQKPRIRRGKIVYIVLVKYPKMLR
jgi:hypothetical protein